jgi:hypothetical protein
MQGVARHGFALFAQLFGEGAVGAFAWCQARAEPLCKGKRAHAGLALRGMMAP